MSYLWGGSESTPETQEEIIVPVAPEPEPEPVEEIKIPTDLTSDEWLTLDINYTPSKPQFVQTILTTFPDCEIIIQTTNPTFREGTRVHLADYYQTYRYYAASRELLFIDYYPAWLEAFKDNPDLYKQYYVDTTHPNLEGTEAVIMPILREYIY